LDTGDAGERIAIAILQFKDDSAAIVRPSGWLPQHCDKSITEAGFNRDRTGLLVHLPIFGEPRDFSENE
jgi:hypothetical protein